MTETTATEGHTPRIAEPAEGSGWKTLARHLPTVELREHIDGRVIPFALYTAGRTQHFATEDQARTAYARALKAEQRWIDQHGQVPTADERDLLAWCAAHEGLSRDDYLAALTSDDIHMHPGRVACKRMGWTEDCGLLSEAGRAALALAAA